MENVNQLPAAEEPQWIYADDAEKEMGIETKVYPNGQKMKRAQLSDGRWAECRRLKGVDAQEITRQMNGQAGKYQEIVMARCTKINGANIIQEELTELFMDDYQLVLMMASINFPGTQNG